MSQRFGIASPDWCIELVDTLKTDSDPQKSTTVGQFDVATMAGTKLCFEETKGPRGKVRHCVVDSNGDQLDDLDAGFDYEGTFYPVTGWVAYSQHPYKDSLMAGVRVYCRGKIAAQTNIFNLKAGFTGEYDIRSYLVGELHADWLDEADDLIRTDRQDILWSHALGQEFQAWGQGMVEKSAPSPVSLNAREHGSSSRRSPRSRNGSQISSLETNKKPSETTRWRLRRSLPNLPERTNCRTPTLGVLVNLSLLLGPHVTLDRKLCEAAESAGDPLSVLTSILITARTAELSAFGKIAEDRIRVIKRVEELKDNKKTLERRFSENLSQVLPG